MRTFLTASTLVACALAQQQNAPLGYLMKYNGVQQVVAKFPNLFDQERYQELADLYTDDGCLRFPVINVTACGKPAIQKFFYSGSRIPGTDETAKTQPVFAVPEIEFSEGQKAHVTVAFSEFIHPQADPTQRIIVHGTYEFTMVPDSNADQRQFPPSWKINDTLYSVYVSINTRTSNMQHEVQGC